MNKFEYKISYMSKTGHETIPAEELNEMGKDGWELIFLIPRESVYGWLHLFKRKIIEEVQND